MQENKIEKKHFFLKAIPKRPTFQLDMTEEERSIMYQHISYWTSLMDKGMVLVFGPVLDPNGGYGIGVVEVESVEQVQSFIADDPAVIAGLFTQEFYPIKAILPQKG